MLIDQEWMDKHVDGFEDYGHALSCFNCFENHVFDGSIWLSENRFKKLLRFSKINHHALLPLMKNAVDRVKLTDAQVGELLGHHSTEIRTLIVANYPLNKENLQSILDNEMHAVVLRPFFDMYKEVLSDMQLEKIHTGDSDIHRKFLWLSEFQVKNESTIASNLLEFNDWKLLCLNKIESKKLKAAFLGDSNERAPVNVL